MLVVEWLCHMGLHRTWHSGRPFNAFQSTTQELRGASGHLDGPLSALPVYKRACKTSRLDPYRSQSLAKVNLRLLHLMQLNSTGFVIQAHRRKDRGREGHGTCAPRRAPESAGRTDRRTDRQTNDTSRSYTNCMQHSCQV